MAGKIPKAPGHLQTDGKKFWRKVLQQYELEDEHHLRLLENACLCLDRIFQAGMEIEADGAIILDRFKQKKEHPAVKIERDCQTLFARLLRELALDFNVPDETRPKRQY